MRLYIENNEDCERFKGHLSEFKNELYIPAFPNEDEREPFENILYRIENNGFPQTKIILEIEDDTVIGGIITDYLSDKIAQPIYIVVRESYRKKGIGRSLLETAVRGYEHAFIEIDNPEKVTAEDSAIEPSARKKMYEQWGFKQTPIDYVQPPLTQGGNYERNLILMHRANLTKGIMKEFLQIFYRALNVANSEELVKMEKQIDNTIF